MPGRLTRRLAGAGLAGVAAAYAGPAAASVGPLRRAVMPGLAGQGRADHLALTYDDGPDPRTTPLFLDLLERYDRHATFFLLGTYAEQYPALTAEIAARGHEVAVHGWTHRCTARLRPRTLREDLARTRGLLQDLTDQPVRWYRPPYGVLTGPALWAAHDTGLETVLWSAWGRDWERSATPSRVVRRVHRTARPGGTVLLHDTDRTSAPGSWAITLEASDRLLRGWAGQPVGRLDEHRKPAGHDVRWHDDRGGG